MNAGANWLDSQSLIGTAEYSTGARGMADAQLRERLEGILAHISAPGILDRAQCFQARDQVLALLCSRLRIASDCKRLPAIQREPIERPISGGSIDWRGLAPGLIDAARDGTQRLLDDPLVDDPRIRHVRFKELVQNPVDVVRSAYDAWNLPYPPTFEAAINEWLSNNRSDRYGRYDYTLDAFGIAADDLKDSF